MNKSFKLVALLLGVVLFGTPLLALANCNPKFATSGHCGEGCPMMMQSLQTAATHVSKRTSGDGSCCRVADLPASAVKPAAIQAKTFVELFIPQTVACVAPVVTFKVEALRVPRSASSDSLQAVLCTFLV